MTRVTVTLPDELMSAISQDIGREAAESGDLKNKSEWIREAAREKLSNSKHVELPAESQEGAA